MQLIKWRPPPTGRSMGKSHMAAPMDPNLRKRVALVTLAPLHLLRHSSLRQYYKEIRMTFFTASSWALSGQWHAYWHCRSTVAAAIPLTTTRTTRQKTT